MSNKENFLRDIPNLKEKVYKDISKDNEDLINFLDIFSQFSKNTNNIKEFIYSNEEISKNFFNLIKLNKNNLEDILDILNCIKENSKNEDLEIYAKELDRGIYELEWIIEEKKLYQSIFENFEDNILSKNSIVNGEYKEDFLQNQYLINTFANKSWKDINKETIINFLEGLDFYYLSNETYFFIIPICIRYGIEKFEDNEDLEYLIFFLSDQDRVKYANNKIKKLVVSYLELVKRLKFVVFGKEEEKCLEIWR
ncbi:primosomal protein N [Fusobacterium hwasookii]|uniref:primosomal protein N n=1 Tax=Fusobacterium hwasookii TaxID=1583098 RepID=UPI0028E39F2A|nr:primosomal protein N [Fusobacterium hwasookii]